MKLAPKVMDRLPSSFENVALDNSFVRGLFIQDQDGTDPPLNDGVVSPPSALRLEAWEESKSRHLVGAGHTGILRQQATVDILNQLLNEALR